MVMAQMQQAMKQQGAEQAPAQAPASAPAQAAAPAGMAAPQQQPATNPIEETLNALPEEQKMFIAEHLTPEIAQVVAILAGDPRINELLLPFVDQERVLVPMPRSEFENLRQGGADMAASAAPAGSAEPTVQPQQQAATPAPSGAGPA